MIKILHMIVKKDNSKTESIRLVDSNLHNRFEENITHIRCIDTDYKEDICFEKLSGYDIKKIYLTKYAAMGTIASFIGYLASLSMNHFFTSNILGSYSSNRSARSIGAME